MLQSCENNDCNVCNKIDTTNVALVEKHLILVDSLLTEIISESEKRKGCNGYFFVENYFDTIIFMGKSIPFDSNSFALNGISKTLFESIDFLSKHRITSACQMQGGSFVHDYHCREFASYYYTRTIILKPQGIHPYWFDWYTIYDTTNNLMLLGYK